MIDRHSTTDQRGIALAVCVVVLLVLTTLTVSLMFVTQSEIWSSANHRMMTQARYAAEAGAQKTSNWLIYQYTPPTTWTGWDLTTSPVRYNGQPAVLSANSAVPSNYPDTTVQAAFSSTLDNQPVAGMGVNAAYSVTATLISSREAYAAFLGGGLVRLLTWQIMAQGNVAGVRSAQVEIVTTLERVAIPLTNFALFATANTCGALSMSGGAQTDSFDSSAGSYAATQQNAEGNVGTNGNLNLGGSPTGVYGTLSTPYTGTGSCSGMGMTALTSTGGTVSGGQLVLPAPLVYPNPPPPSPAPPTTNDSTNGNCGSLPGCTQLGPKNLALAPGAYGNLSIAATTTVHFSAGTYNLNSLSVTSNSVLTIDSGPVFVNLAGSGVGTVLNFSGGSVGNLTAKPASLQFSYAGTGAITLSGGAEAYGVVYAPNAAISFSGGTDWYGAVLGGTVANTGGTIVHYDRSLPNNLVIPGKYQQVMFSWKKF